MQIPKQATTMVAQTEHIKYMMFTGISKHALVRPCQFNHLQQASSHQMDTEPLANLFQPSNYLLSQWIHLDGVVGVHTS